MWSVAEILLRSLSLEIEPRRDGSIHRIEEEDEFGGAGNSKKAETLSSNLEIDDREDVMNSSYISSHSLRSKGKYLESISLLSTIMETSEEDDIEKVHGNVHALATIISTVICTCSKQVKLQI